MADVVLHPETGKPAVAVVTYKELEIELLEAHQGEIKNQLTAANERLSAEQAEVARLESELEEAKSLVDGYNSLTPDETGVGSEQAGTSVDVSDSLDETALAAPESPVVNF